MLPPSLACLTCNPCTTSALFEYFGCGLTPYAARKKSKVDINVPALLSRLLPVSLAQPRH